MWHHFKSSFQSYVVEEKLSLSIWLIVMGQYSSCTLEDERCGSQFFLMIRPLRSEKWRNQQRKKKNSLKSRWSRALMPKFFLFSFLWLLLHALNSIIHGEMFGCWRYFMCCCTPSLLCLVLMIRSLLPNRPTDTRLRHGERWGRESTLFILTVRPARPQEEVERKNQDPPKTSMSTMVDMDLLFDCPSLRRTKPPVSFLIALLLSLDSIFLFFMTDIGNRTIKSQGCILMQTSNAMHLTEVYESF